MGRCDAVKLVSVSARGKQAPKDKPFRVPCNLQAGHGGPHANEVRDNKPIRGEWT